MSFNTRVFIVNNIKLPINASYKEAFSVAKTKLRRLGVDASDAELSIYKKSVDARRKQDIKFVYSVRVSGIDTDVEDSRFLDEKITPLREEASFAFEKGTEKLTKPPLIVGAGPAGLFAALLLAENGYAPTVIERGGSISERKASVEKFKSERILDTDTNIQFGAGGAGTFSDGKLITRVNDPLTSYVLEKFVEFGAPEEILYQARPHIGTDVLSVVIDNMIAYLTQRGGKILYHTRFITAKENVAKTTKGDIEYGALILAPGHSARDTYETLIAEGYNIEAKNFSVGMRIEHLASDIDRALYGDFASNPILGHAEYNLSFDTKNRGVYTFCMCPGGVVVPAASEVGGVVVNGMSYHSRGGKNSNCAVVTSIFKEDYGATPLLAIEFQRAIERKAYLSAGSDYSAPIITVGDFLTGKCNSAPSDIIPSYMDNKNSVRIVSPEKYLPKIVCDQTKSALIDFNKKIPGFSKDSAVLTGPETRTSAPVRILRDNETRVALGKDNIYPAGEGAGYAGGITSAALDGIKTAVAVIKRYSPLEN